MVPLFDGGDDVGMVLSPQVSGFEFFLVFSEKKKKNKLSFRYFFLSQPFLSFLSSFLPSPSTPLLLPRQCFHNLNQHADIFNHSNVHFWE